MDINDRIKVIRKEKGMTMEMFGSKLGVTKVAISRIESGDRNVTEQMFLAICREFNVNPDWLRDGVGEPFREVTRNGRIEDFIKDILTDEPEGRKTRLIDALASLDNDGWNALYGIAEHFVGEQKTAADQEDNNENNEKVAASKGKLSAFQTAAGGVDGTGEDDENTLLPFA